MTTARKKSSILILIGICLLVALSSGGAYTIYVTHTIKSDASIINRLGIIRGSMQHLVKLEIGGQQNDELIHKIDSNIAEFDDKKLKIYDKNDEIKYALDNLSESWFQLKGLIYEYRENPTGENLQFLLEESQKIWDEANNMVLISQVVSEKKMSNFRISHLFVGINLTLGILIIYLIKRYVQDTLEYLVNYDGLTKVYNRRYFNEYLNKEIARAERYNKPLALIIFDIDYFKRVNDKFGHDVGDCVLEELCNLVQISIRKSDSLFRLGGEEFGIVTPETDIDKALILSEKLRKIVETYNFKYVGEIRISLGIAQYVLGDDIDSVYKRADIALYKAKEGGRNRSEVEVLNLAEKHGF